MLKVGRSQILLILALGSLSFVSVLASSALAADLNAPTARAWSILGSMQISSNIHETHSADYSADMTSFIRPSFKIGEYASIDARFAVTKQLTGDRFTLLDDLPVSLRILGLTLSPTIKYYPSLTLIAPMSTLSRNEKSLILGTQLGQRLVFNELFTKRLDAYYGLSLARNFYRYATSFPGESNTLYSVSNLVSLSYTLTDPLSFWVNGSQALGWTSGGSPKTKYELSEELWYQINETLSAAIGHSNGGSAFKENGRDLNIAVFNGNTSLVYGSLTYKY